MDKKRGRPQKQTTALSKELIMETAKTMMLTDKKTPSVRALANKLGVDAMAIYHYFKNKGDMLEAITTSLINDIYQPEQSSDWQGELMKLAKSYLTLLKNYDGLLQTLLSMSSTSPADEFISRFKFIISPMNLTESEEEVFLNLLVDYLHGFSIALAFDKEKHLSLDDIIQPLNLVFRAVTSH